MTTIAAKIEKDKIIIGADSRASAGWTKVEQTLESSKIVEGSDMIIAATGTITEASLMELFCKDHSIGSGGQLRLVEWLLEFSEWKHSKTNVRGVENNYIVAHKSGLYKTHGLSVSKIKTFTSDGSGGEFCFTALHLGHTLEQSLKVSCELDAFSEEPIIIKTMKLEGST